MSKGDVDVLGYILEVELMSLADIWDVVDEKKELRTC